MAVIINGDGMIEVDGTASTQGRVRLKEDTDNGTNYVELQAPASVTTNRTITFPDESGTVITNTSLPISALGINAELFTSNGTFTIPTGVTQLKVTVIGGGGNGGSANGAGCFPASGGHGAGGGLAIGYLTGLTPGNTISATVGGAGGTSTFSTISATGGASGATGSSNAGANGATPGSGSGGLINITGSVSTSAGIGSERYGGGCGAAITPNGYFGGRGGASRSTSGNGNPATGRGCGGAGASSSNGITYSGGAGLGGAILVEW